VPGTRGTSPHSRFESWACPCSNVKTIHRRGKAGDKYERAAAPEGVVEVGGTHRSSYNIMVEAGWWTPERAAQKVRADLRKAIARSEPLAVVFWPKSPRRHLYKGTQQPNERCTGGKRCRCDP
jgi:hypothetical protein